MWIKFPATPKPSPKAHINSKISKTVHNMGHLIFGRKVKRFVRAQDEPHRTRQVGGCPVCKVSGQLRIGLRAPEKATFVPNGNDGRNIAAMVSVAAVKGAPANEIARPNQAMCENGTVSKTRHFRRVPTRRFICGRNRLPFAVWKSS
jgi:hypothetical protein